MSSQTDHAFDGLCYREGLDIFEDLGLGVPEGVDCTIIFLEENIHERYEKIMLPTTDVE